MSAHPFHPPYPGIEDPGPTEAELVDADIEALPWIVEAKHFDDGWMALDYGPWIDGAWTGASACEDQVFATEPEAVSRMLAERAHLGGDWIQLRVRHRATGAVPCGLVLA